MANKLPKVKNLYIELACRLSHASQPYFSLFPVGNKIYGWLVRLLADCDAMPLHTPLVPTVKLSVSAYMDIDFPLMTADAKCQQFASHFSIS